MEVHSMKRDERRHEAVVDEIKIDEESAVIAAELMPVAIFLGWSWDEVRPNRELHATAA